jgi:uncharacterized membrane protein (UPF0127 family)
LRAAALLALACLPLQAATPGEPTGKPQALATRTLTITGKHRPIHFKVEVARTEIEQEIGLMNRKTMPADHGMVFPLVPERMATFWMRNTYLSLDMIFIRGDGTISSIAPNVKPLSDDITGSFEPVAAVLELNAGAAAKAGIKPGDKVRW